jgi:hypothetical protein
MDPSRQSEPRPIRIGAVEPLAPPLEVPTLDEILGRVVPVDFLGALAGRRGPVLHIAEAAR